MEPLDLDKDKNSLNLLLKAAKDCNAKNENNNLCKQLCNFKKKVIETMKRNYLPRDVVNAKHVIQVFNIYEYKPLLINQEIQKMRTLKRSSLVSMMWMTASQVQSLLVASLVISL